MKPQWDYTDMADAYLKRPDYADLAVDKILELSGINPSNTVCDVGAGVAHLTIKLARRDLNVVAIEPNDAMRKNGMQQTLDYPAISWIKGTGENTGQQNDIFKLVTFGSSFNVTNRIDTLKETARILKADGWFACMWNHRRLDDPVQSEIENIIQTILPDYAYGIRREDQADIINQSGLFGKIHKFEASVCHEQTVDDCMEAWQSHATLKRQSGNKFGDIMKKIKNVLTSTKMEKITVPYDTRVWIAQRNN